MILVSLEEVSFLIFRHDFFNQKIFVDFPRQTDQFNIFTQGKSPEQSGLYRKLSRNFSGRKETAQLNHSPPESLMKGEKNSKLPVMLVALHDHQVVKDDTGVNSIPVLSTGSSSDSVEYRNQLGLVLGEREYECNGDVYYTQENFYNSILVENIDLAATSLINNSLNYSDSMKQHAGFCQSQSRITEQANLNMAEFADNLPFNNTNKASRVESLNQMKSNLDNYLAPIQDPAVRNGMKEILVKKIDRGLTKVNSEKE